MFRFYKKFIATVLLDLLYLRDAVGNTEWGTAKRNAEDRWYRSNAGRNPETVAAVQNIIKKIGIEQQDLGEIILELSKVINSDKNIDIDLIDTVARILTGGYTRNILTGETLNHLRKALLTPDEFAVFKRRVLEKEAGCASCGKKLAQGEMASFTKDSYGVGFLCTNCYTPVFVACPVGNGDCDHSYEIPPKRLGWIGKAKEGCPTCLDKKKGRELNGDVVVLENGNTAGTEAPLPAVNDPTNAGTMFRRVNINGQVTAVPVAEEAQPNVGAIHFNAVENDEMFRRFNEVQATEIPTPPTPAVVVEDPPGYGARFGQYRAQPVLIQRPAGNRIQTAYNRMLREVEGRQFDPYRVAQQLWAAPTPAANVAEVEELRPMHIIEERGDE